MKKNRKAMIGALAAIAMLAAPALANAAEADADAGQARPQAQVQATPAPMRCVAPLSAPAAGGRAGWRKSDTAEGCTLTVKAEGADNMMPNAVSNEVQHVTFAGPTKTVFSNAAGLNLSYKSNLVTFTSANMVDSSPLASMSHLFMVDPSLERIDLTGFDTSRVTTMDNMFYGDVSLRSLDLGNFDTANVTTMDSMFAGCHLLGQLSIGSFDTANVTTMDSMFSGDVSLRSLDLRNFDTANVTTMASMFSGCHLLGQLTITGFDTANVTTMQNMFAGLNRNGGTPMALDLSSFRTGNVENMSGMFSNAKVSAVPGLGAFDTGKVRYMSKMFSTSSLTALDLSGWDMTKTQASPGCPLPPGQAPPSAIWLPAGLTQLTVGPATRLDAGSSFSSTASTFTWTQVTGPSSGFDHDASYTTSQLADRVNAASAGSSGTYLRQVKRSVTLNNGTPPSGYSAATIPPSGPAPLVATGYDADRDLPDGNGGTTRVATRPTKVRLPGNSWYIITYVNGGRETKDFTFDGWKDETANKVYQPGDVITLSSDTLALKAVWTSTGRDSRDLNDEYLNDRGITDDHYSEATWNAFRTALRAADNVLDDGSKGQADVDTTLRDLRDAKAKLDRSPLQILADNANGLVQGDYTSDSWNGLQAALSDAETVLGKHNPTQAEISAATNRLTGAMKALERRNPNGRNKAALTAAIGEAAHKEQVGNNDRYDISSWARFIDALDLAESTQNDPNATQSTIDNAWQHLIDAIAGLEPISGHSSQGETGRPNGSGAGHGTQNGTIGSGGSGHQGDAGANGGRHGRSGSSNGNARGGVQTSAQRGPALFGEEWPVATAEGATLDSQHDSSGTGAHKRVNHVGKRRDAGTANTNGDAEADPGSTSARRASGWAGIIALVVLIAAVCLIVWQVRARRAGGRTDDTGADGPIGY
ncbi:BspA family leucine-rich repeat surface protein [Bifidobacterium sp. ESL0763]|uniref:BspA family leucine-rich repeat surface protein n=1 Tax=Bifidobacterium sp. ESL0763 TaxID=2983227 RepID=UPI0023F90464|nr:BspA family leucine-rich repeat surface protein [Bifidobacterium sp. ESL0763]MDF7663136.1 BspA family leucine-rich repeat surface protein [Bifidobacterium sp. ESL0763]